MLDAALTTQLSAYLTKITRPIVLQSSLDDGPKSRELAGLLDEIAALSDKITVMRSDDDPRRPSFVIRPADGDAAPISLRFAGIPLGHEFTSLVLALLQVGGHPSTLAQELLDQVRALPGEHHFETYFSLSCQNCPDVVQALNLMAVLNPGVSHVAIDGALYQDEIDARQILAVPTVFHNGQLFGQGRMTLDEIVAKLDSGAIAREAERLNGMAPFDVLVVGGGPAGAAAAIYAARKGIRTGVVSHVTLLEFDPQLRADEVLQRSLRSLSNVDVVVSARTTEVIGDGGKVTALTYEDRTDGSVKKVDLNAVFVQIGLLPNTEWLGETVARTPRGEIEIDAAGHTSVPGVFAAGDCTTVPYKQIVIAMGAGATASLAAFDHLIRTSAPA